MKRRIIFSMIMIMAALLVVSVGAFAAIDDSGIIFEEDFTRPEAEANNPDWKPEGWELNSTKGEIERVHEDGYVELKQNGAASNAEVMYRYNGSLPKEFTLMYDVCWDSYTNRLGYQTSFLGGYNLNINSAGTAVTYDGSAATGAPDFDVWTTYVIQVKNGYADYYKKNADEEEFEKVAENVRLAPSTTSYFRIYVYDGSATGSKQVSAKVDNVKLFSGTYLTDSEITISEDKSKITGRLVLGSAEVPADSAMPTTVIMSAYDKKGKFMNIVTDVTQSVFYGEGNEIVVEMPCNEEFYNSIKGGTIELYVWNSMDGIKPICDTVILEVE